MKTDGNADEPAEDLSDRAKGGVVPNICAPAIAGNKDPARAAEAYSRKQRFFIIQFQIN
ncbi:MAG: hypothetical protein V4713_01345 [Pseudomonadota bacterium]